MAEAVGGEESGGAVEDGAGGGEGVWEIGEEEGFGEGGHGPWPCGAVVIGWFAAGVFVAGVVGPERVERVVEEVAVAEDWEREGDGSVGECADGTGDEEFRAGEDDGGGADGVGDRAERDGEELVRAEVVVAGGEGGWGAGGSVETVGEPALGGMREEGFDGVGDAEGELGAGWVAAVGAHEREGGVPECLDFDGIALARGSGGVVCVHPCEVGGTEDESGGGVGVDPVGGAGLIVGDDGAEDGADGATAGGFVEEGRAGGADEVGGGGEEPERGVGGVAVGAIASANHVRERAAVFEAGEGEEDETSGGGVSGGDEPAEGDECVAAPVEEPWVACDDGVAGVAADDELEECVAERPWGWAGEVRGIGGEGR